MASRAGRHRDTGRWDSPDRPSLLLLDYLETGSFSNYLGRAPGPARSAADSARGAAGPDRSAAGPRHSAAGPARRRRRGSRRFRRLRSGLRRLSADGRILVAVVLASIVAAVLVGIYAPLRSSWASPGRHPAAPSPAAPSPAPLTPAPSATSLAPAAIPSPKPTPSRPRTARRTTPPRQAAMIPAPSAAPSSRPAARMSHGAATRKPAVIVRFIVNSQGVAGFEGQVQVVNDTAEPISGWQIVIALPEDQIVTVTNATGFVSNGILILQPAFGAPPVPANGGVLNVFFIAEGFQTTPGACTFNQIPCT